MSTTNRRAGIVYLRRNGSLLEAKGNFSYGMGTPKREAMTDESGHVIGYKETPTVPFIEGTIIDSRILDVKELYKADDDTYTLELANGKVEVLRNAWYAGDGTGETEEATLQVRWEGKSMEEVR